MFFGEVDFSWCMGGLMSKKENGEHEGENRGMIG